MKIEKLSDNQIRCTLTRADLAARQLQLSELAYGTEKAKSLFRDMMQQAAFEFGFEADDIPLMIEAIPASADSIVLIITKVEDPEELDTRFSKFAPASGPDTDFQKNQPSKLEGADALLDLLDKVKEKMSPQDSEQSSVEKTASVRPALRLFSFSTLDTVQKAVPTPYIRTRAKTYISWLCHSPDIQILILTGSAICCQNTGLWKKPPDRPWHFWRSTAKRSSPQMPSIHSQQSDRTCLKKDLWPISQRSFSF